ncbi:MULTISPECIES: hypothetical protein [unclassified Streptomyces]|uniref:hypothetical protein n=1 Tax=unclassified Streptomyces TaxID=2593676 RepID=UPI00380A899C
MQITEDALKRAWHEIAAGSELLDDAMFPPTGTSPGQYPQRVSDPDGLFLVLDEDGAVHGHHGPYASVFTTRELDQVLYFAAEEAVTRLVDRTRSSTLGLATNLVTEQAEMMDRIDPAWGRRFRSGGIDGTRTAQPCGRDPLERLAWIADTWRDQDPYTHLAFFRGKDVSAEQIALLHGADPEQIATGMRLSDLRAMEASGRDHGDIAWESCCFGQAGDWAFLMYHETPPGIRADHAALSRLGVTETVELSATMGKGIYSFYYTRDGRSLDDGWGMLELIWYKEGRAPYYRGGQLDFLNQAIRRAELDHPELIDTFDLYFHALDDALGLQLPQQDIKDGTVRSALWAGSNSGRGQKYEQ